MPKKVRPIRPKDVASEKEKTFPDAVIASFNEMIAKAWNGSEATIRQDDIVALMVEKGLEQREIFDKGLLNVESVYRSVGWSVVYDRPGYDESYPTTFTFKRRRKG